MSDVCEFSENFYSRIIKSPEKLNIFLKWPNKYVNCHCLLNSSSATMSRKLFAFHKFIERRALTTYSNMSARVIKEPKVYRDARHKRALSHLSSSWCEKSLNALLNANQNISRQGNVNALRTFWTDGSQQRLHVHLPAISVTRNDVNNCSFPTLTSFLIKWSHKSNQPHLWDEEQTIFLCSSAELQ